MKEVHYLCDYCGQNLGITEEEKDRKMVRNVLVGGVGYVNIKLHGEHDHMTPKNAILHVNLTNVAHSTYGRDVCSDCLLQGKTHLDIGMPERTEDEKV